MAVSASVAPKEPCQTRVVRGKKSDPNFVVQCNWPFSRGKLI